MHEQIRIAANRRCEMTIARERQRVVVAAASAVTRLFQGPQERDLHPLRMGTVLGRLHHALQPAPIVRRPQGKAQAAGKLREPIQRRFVGLVVHAKNAGELLRQKILRDDAVGRQHILFDELMRPVDLRTLHANDIVVGVQHNPYFGQIHIQRSFAQAAFSQDPGKFARFGKHRHEFPADDRLICFVVVVKHCLHGPVRQRVVRANHAALDFMIHPFAVRRKFDGRRLGQAIAAAAQAAKVTR